MGEKTVYSTWIRTNKILLFWILGFGILATTFLGFLYAPLFFIGVVSVPFLYIAMIISLTSYKFSEKGGDFQNKIHDLVISHCPLSDNALDIGCGNGNMIIRYAKRYPKGKYTGIDYWGNNWEYSKNQCIKNAMIEKIDNISFHQASASKLPFDNETFSNVISCLTYHEVQDVESKIESLFEALRVLKINGRFAFFDLFNDKRFYSGKQIILEEISKHGAKNVEYKNIQDILELPFPLNGSKSLRYGVLISGEK